MLRYFEENEPGFGEVFEETMHEQIMDVIRNEKDNIKKWIGMFSKGRKMKFFEMVRFDFIIDDKKKVWLMEINMSPNLSSGHFEANAVLYRKVVKWALTKGALERC